MLRRITADKKRWCRQGGGREIVTKQLELLHETAPSAQTIGFLINATNPYVELDVQDVAAASDRLRRKLVVCESRPEMILSRPLQPLRIGA